MTFQRSSTCTDCGARISWARSEKGAWLPMELEPFAGKDVPGRYRMTQRQGVAMPTPKALQVCVVTHFVVCPAKIRHLEFLKETWPAMGQRAERHQAIRGAGRRRGGPTIARFLLAAAVCVAPALADDQPAPSCVEDHVACTTCRERAALPGLECRTNRDGTLVPVACDDPEFIADARRLVGDSTVGSPRVEVREDCLRRALRMLAAGTACYVKQLGAQPRARLHELNCGPGGWADHVGGKPAGDRYRPTLRDRKGADITEWPADLQVREFPA